MRTRRDGGAPADTFLVGRIRRTFRGQSSVGAILTSRDSESSGNQLYGVDTFLRFFEKLEVSSYLMRTRTPARTDGDWARRLGAVWRDDDWSASGEYEETQPGFNPEVGFLRRPDTGRYSAELSWRPRPAAGRWIRNYVLETSADYYASSSTNVLETRQQSASAGLSLQSGASFGTTVARTLERLDEPFAIRPDVILPVGDYEFTSVAFNYSTDQSRPVAGSASVSAGQFWNGHSASTSGSLTLKPNYHLSAAMTFSRNDVRLPAGDFVATLVGARLLYGFTSKVFLHSFLQYNAATNQFSANTRFNIIHRPLSDLFVVYNERRDTATGRLVDRGLILKLTNLFDF